MRKLVPFKIKNPRLAVVAVAHIGVRALIDVEAPREAMHGENNINRIGARGLVVFCLLGVGEGAGVKMRKVVRDLPMPKSVPFYGRDVGRTTKHLFHFQGRPRSTTPYGFLREAAYYTMQIVLFVKSGSLSGSANSDRARTSSQLFNIFVQLL